MMLLKEMFTKPIDRDLKGVIKVGQDDDSNVWQELDEYVVTTELQKHFKTFFSNYASGINQETDKMGVWISGYFGSGKSHFLKILAYLLENRKINGKQSIEFFEESGKIKDSFDLANMKKAASVSTDVILFNIGAKNQSTDSAQDPILKVFLRVFNEHLGLFGANPHIADLERQLFRSGLFDKFKSQFREVTGNEWELTRPEFKFLTGKICTILSQIGFMSEEIAKNWCAHVLDPYELSIEDFAKMVAEYLATNPRDHHLVFLIDEIGQFIGEDVRLMLSLQTVVEQLGIWCKGKVWVIVTSQEAIDKITDVKGKDFSKIQGRFDTRLNLSSANVDEVIRKRILEKKNAAIQSLAVVYEQKATQIKNSICFDDNIEKKLYSCPDDFISIYPFVPYQFKLLSAVLTAIREHGSSGKHLSEGERSMLAMFKESAVRVMDNELGQLIPFNFFYDNVESYLDSGHKRVISDALGNERINPSHEDFCFDVEVLKVLFLIKYVKEISATANNIISLMVSEIDEDRVVLTKKVEKALERLESQTLIQRNGDRYVFLSSEEQEVNQEIKNIDVVSSEIVRETGTNFFGDLLQLDSFTYQKKYPFGLNQYVDSTELRVRGSNKLGIRLITPYYDNGADKSGISLMSVQEKNIIVFLPQNCPV